MNARGPFASVYFGDSHDTAESDVQLEVLWRDVRRDLEDKGAGADVLDRLENAVLHHQPAVGRRGRVLIATGQEVLVDEGLINPPPAPVVRLSDYPYLVPLIDQEMQRPTYAVAAVDHTGAEVTLHQGKCVTTATIVGAGFPVHKPVTAGWNGYGDLQHTTEEAIRMNCRAVPSICEGWSTKRTRL